MSIPLHDRTVLRRLAGRYRKIADSEANRALKERWTDLNDLNHTGPPLLLVSPGEAWSEITSAFPVECESEMARGWETQLRIQIYRYDVIRDDSAFEPTLIIQRPVGISDFGIPFNQTASSESRGSYHDEPVLTDLETDLNRLHFRKIEVDHDAFSAEFESAQETLGDLLDVVPNSTYWWTCGLTWTAIKLIGLENLMMAMYDDPDGLHRLMRFLSEEMLNFITFFEKEELLDYNAGANFVGSGNLGFTSDLPSRHNPVDGPVKLKHLWGLTESQETVGVSPDMFGEFIFPYQKPLQEQFGLNYYGCCEPVEKRWPYIQQVPNLRALSVSPWSDQAKCAEVYGRDYVYCRKPNPSPVCMGFNESKIREEFEETFRYSGDLNTVMVLKDTHTVENEPDRFTRWVEIGRQVLDSAPR